MENSNRKPNFQVYPSRIRVEPNDRLSKVLFSLTDADYRYLIESQKSVNFVEMKSHKKFGEIFTPLQINKDGENFSITEPLNILDWAILSVCTSEWYAENQVITPAIIQRGLTGKFHDTNNVSSDQLTVILSAIEKLMRLQISVDLSNVCEKLKYNNGIPKKLVSTLLPCQYITATVNGRDATTIQLLAEPPLLTIAKLKNGQILTYDASLLDVPGQRNTPVLIAAKNYVMRRFQEVKLHKLTPTITFADIFEKCRITDADNKTKLRVREAVVHFFKHLSANYEIKSFKINKQRNAFHSVKFTF